MKDFPEFMKTPENLVASTSQSKGVKGWVYDGLDGKQMAYWICEIDGVSKEHVHEFDEYFTVIQGKYTLIINGKKIDVCKGDEYFIPQNVSHAGRYSRGFWSCQ
jgi:quercetin dioxygenase-like cupin family protein